MDNELKPCPFCGGSARILVCDEEGNIHDDAYEDDPWSGLRFGIQHDLSNANEDCPVATYEGELIGGATYDMRDEATETWNRRVNTDGTK